MSAKMKTVLKRFDYMHCDDFAKYLSDMAAKGWHFKEWGAGLKFEQGQPESAMYAVEVFSKASENDMRPEPKTQEFAEYCEAAGWEFIDAKQKFCIFKKIEESAVEMFTPKERVVNAFKGMTSGSAILSLVIYGAYALLQWIDTINNFERYIFSNVLLLPFFAGNILFLSQVCRFIYAFWKKNRLIQAIKKGEEVYLGNCKDSKLHIYMQDIYGGILIVLFMAYMMMIGKIEFVLVYVIAIAILMIFSIVIAKMRPDSYTNFKSQIIFGLVFVVTLIPATIIISDNDNDMLQKDKLPLQISDYREFNEEIENVDIYHDGNPLGSRETYYILSKENCVRYYIYRTEHAWILDKIWETALDARFNEGAVDCTTDWTAKKAVRNKLGTYYVRYNNSILVFSDDEDIYLSSEQIDIICEKLNVK